MQPTKLSAHPSLHRSLEGQRIVIIGGRSGFRMATAKAASPEGASVVVASSKRTNVDRALDELPVGAEGHVLNITQESAVTDFLAAVGEFDHLAITAGESLDLGEFAVVALEKADQARPLAESGNPRILQKPISISCANASAPEL